MTNIQIHPGDVLRWRREDDKGVRCTVLAVSQDGQRAQLRVDGWLGTHWETITHAFVRYEEVRS